MSKSRADPNSVGLTKKYLLRNSEILLAEIRNLLSVSAKRANSITISISPTTLTYQNRLCLFTRCHVFPDQEAKKEKRREGED